MDTTPHTKTKIDCYNAMCDSTYFLVNYFFCQHAFAFCGGVQQADWRNGRILEKQKRSPSCPPIEYLKGEKAPLSKNWQKFQSQQNNFLSLQQNSADAAEFCHSLASCCISNSQFHSFQSTYSENTFYHRNWPFLLQ